MIYALTVHTYINTKALKQKVGKMTILICPFLLLCYCTVRYILVEISNLLQDTLIYLKGGVVYYSIVAWPGTNDLRKDQVNFSIGACKKTIIKVIDWPRSFHISTSTIIG